MPTPKDKQGSDWNPMNDDGYFFPPQAEQNSEDDFDFDDLSEEIELSFRENFEKTFLHVH